MMLISQCCLTHTSCIIHPLIGHRLLASIYNTNDTQWSRTGKKQFAAPNQSYLYVYSYLFTCVGWFGAETATAVAQRQAGPLSQHYAQTNTAVSNTAATTTQLRKSAEGKVDVAVQKLPATCPPLSKDPRAIELRASFEKVYSSALWRHGDSNIPLSGSGSTVARTEMARQAIQQAVKETGATLFIDASCGDATWMPLLFDFFEEQHVAYLGLDIVPSLIEQHNAKYGKDGQRQFCVVDSVRTVAPAAADIIFSRETLQHLSEEDLMSTIRNWKQSGAKYLLMTDYPEQANNAMKSGLYHGTNHVPSFRTAPYNFPEPITAYPEANPGTKQVLALWAFKDLPL